MKVNAKMKMIVAAVALAATGVSNAEIISPNVEGGNGELMFTIWDETVGKEASFNMGLNVRMDDFVSSNPIALSNVFSNPTYVQYLGGGNGVTHNQADLKWNITAGSNLGDFERAMTTAESGRTPESFNFTNGPASSMAQATGTYVDKLQSTGACDPCGTDMKLDPKYAGDNFGKDFNTQVLLDNSGKVGGAALGFYSFSSTVGSSGYADGADSPSLGSNNGGYTFQVTTDGNVMGVSAVPVPAAVWLLGSALVGLVGVARRRNNVAA